MESLLISQKASSSGTVLTEPTPGHGSCFIFSKDLIYLKGKVIETEGEMAGE